MSASPQHLDRPVAAGRGHRRRGLASAALLALAALTLAACTQGAHPVLEGAETRTVTGAFGDVVVATHPERIVALDGTLETLLAYNAPVIAATSQPGQTDSAASAIAGSLRDGSFDLTAIETFAPDLIVATMAIEPENRELIEALNEKLQNIGPTVIVDATVSDSFAATFAVADAAGYGPQASADRERVESAVTELLGEHPKGFTGQTVLIAQDAEDERDLDAGSVRVFTATSWLGEVVEQFGGKILQVDRTGADESPAPSIVVESADATTLSGATIILEPALPQTTAGRPTPSRSALLSTLPAALDGRSFPVASANPTSYASAVETLKQLKLALLLTD